MTNDIWLMTHKFLLEESGQDLIEYVLIASLLALAATASVNTLATGISSAMAGVASKFTSAI